MCNFREKNIVEIKNDFFLVFFHQQMKIWKNLEKVNLRQNFLLYSNCIYHNCKMVFLFKMPLIIQKTLKNTSFIIFFRKKVYCGNIQCFLFIVCWKQWNKQKIIKKLTFSVKRNFFREIPYILFFWTKIKMIFLR